MKRFVQKVAMFQSCSLFPDRFGDFLSGLCCPLGAAGPWVYLARPACGGLQLGLFLVQHRIWRPDKHGHRSSGASSTLPEDNLEQLSFFWCFLLWLGNLRHGQRMCRHFGVCLSPLHAAQEKAVTSCLKFPVVLTERERCC